MTHPQARTKPRARNARPSPKRYRLTLLGQALLEAIDARDRARDAGAIAIKNRRALAQLRALNNALLAAGFHTPPAASNK